MVSKKTKQKIIKITLITICLLFLFILIINNSEGILADVGNNNRYNEGSGSSSGNGDSFIFFYLFEMLFRFIFIFGPIPGVIIIGLMIALFYFIYRKNGKKIKAAIDQIKDISVTSGNESLNNMEVRRGTTKQITTEIQELDPNFSSDKFLSWTREVFIKLQEAWTERNWHVIRPFESEELFSLHKTQLAEYIKNGKINKIEKININYTSLRDFKIDGDKEVLIVELHAIMRDYVIDEKTKKVLESNPNKDWHMKYLLTFYRKKGIKTEEGKSNKSTTNCPNCGAPTEITSAGQCEYCTSVITTGEHDWVLSDLQSIK